jgi:hypothetical protein
MAVEPKRSAQIKTIKRARLLAKAKIPRINAAMQIRQGDVAL